MRMFLFTLILSCGALFGCSENELANIKDKNNYHWQQFMNEIEFNQLKQGLSYIQVVEIAGGEGELIKEGTYTWPDELLLTRAYEITFENDKLQKKEIIERRGASIRDLIEQEKEPAKRE